MPDASDNKPVLILSKVRRESILSALKAGDWPAPESMVMALDDIASLAGLSPWTMVQAVTAILSFVGSMTDDELLDIRIASGLKPHGKVGDFAPALVSEGMVTIREHGPPVTGEEWLDYMACY